MKNTHDQKYMSNKWNLSKWKRLIYFPELKLGFKSRISDKQSTPQTKFSYEQGRTDANRQSTTERTSGTAVGVMDISPHESRSC